MRKADRRFVAALSRDEIVERIAPVRDRPAKMLVSPDTLEVQHTARGLRLSRRMQGPFAAKGSVCVALRETDAGHTEVELESVDGRGRAEAIGFVLAGALLFLPKLLGLPPFFALWGLALAAATGARCYRSVIEDRRLRNELWATLSPYVLPDPAGAGPYRALSPKSRA